MKALVGAINQEKALVGAFSVIVKTDCETDGSFYSTNVGPDRSVPASLRPQSGTILVTSHAPAFADTAIALQTLTYKAVPWS